MIITINYRAKLSYRKDLEDGDYVKIVDQLCDIIHEIDTETLQSISFRFFPVIGSKG